MIVAIFALALLTNLMALFVAWRGEKRLKEIATADVPSANAADEFPCGTAGREADVYGLSVGGR